MRKTLARIASALAASIITFPSAAYAILDSELAQKVETILNVCNLDRNKPNPIFSISHPSKIWKGDSTVTRHFEFESKGFKLIQIETVSKKGDTIILDGKLYAFSGSPLSKAVRYKLEDNAPLLTAGLNDNLTVVVETFESQITHSMAAFSAGTFYERLQSNAEYLQYPGGLNELERYHQVTTTNAHPLCNSEIVDHLINESFY